MEVTDGHSVGELARLFDDSGLDLLTADLDAASRILTVTRAVVQVDPKFHPQGLRFHVKP